MNSHFKRGSGMFQCRNCGRNTRDTGNDNGGVLMCRDCYDGCGYENEASDGIDPEGMERARECFQRAVDKGGKIPGFQPKAEA